MRLHLIAAIARDRVIGRDGEIPWDLPEDRQRFKAVTMGHAILMGRTTWLSLGRPLPLRRNVILTHQRISQMECHDSLEKALKALQDEREVYVIGGGKVYAETIGRADELNLTLVEKTVKGDTFFPEYERLLGKAFKETGRDQRKGFAFVDYVKV